MGKNNDEEKDRTKVLLELYFYGKCSTHFLIITRKKRKKLTWKRGSASAHNVKCFGLSPIVRSPIARALSWSVVDVTEQKIHQDGDGENVRILVVNFSIVSKVSDTYFFRCIFSFDVGRISIIKLGLTCRDHRRTCRERWSCWRWESQSPKLDVMIIVMFDCLYKLTT